MRKVISILLVVFPLIAFGESVKTTLIVEGMTCASCAGSIERSIRKIPEVDSVDISVKAGKVTVAPKEGKKLSPDQIKKAIEEAGYKVKITEGSK